MAAIKVVFDTNAFQRDTFDMLDVSPIRQLCRSGRVVPLYGHVFLEEMFRAYGNEAKRPDLVNRWLPFLADTAHRLCNDFLTIWHHELVRGLGRKTCIFMPTRDQLKLLGRLRAIPADGSWRAWQSAQAEIAAENTKRTAQRDVSKSIRVEVADWRKAVNYHPKRHGVTHFREFSSGELDRSGREFITALVSAYNSREVANRWSRTKQQYPYFTNFVVNMLYMTYHAAVHNNDRIDENAQADLDLMTHLLHADILVSNETRFMRRAFTDLWEPRGKVLLTSEQFVDFLGKL